MNSLGISQILFVLIVGLSVIQSNDFCDDYKKFEVIGESGYGLKFIPMKDTNYIFLNHTNLDNIYVYELDVSCTDRTQCPKIGGRQKFAEVFPDHKGELRMGLIQDGITYMFSGESDNVIAYENKVKKQVFKESEFWKFDNITSAVLYQWGDHRRYAIKMFLPTESHKELKPQWALQMDSIQYFDSRDKDLKIYYTVEVRGNYAAVNFVRTAGSLFFTFGDYLLSHDMMAYLPLPGGDAIFTIPYSKPYYVRQNGMEINLMLDQDIKQLFGCDGTPLPEKPVLSDIPNHNVYPYFVKT